MGVNYFPHLQLIINTTDFFRHFVDYCILCLNAHILTSLFFCRRRHFALKGEASVEFESKRIYFIVSNLNAKSGVPCVRCTSINSTLSHTVYVAPLDVCVHATADVMDLPVFAPPVSAAAPPFSNTANDSKFN